MNNSKLNSPHGRDNSKKKKKNKSFQNEVSHSTLVYCPSNNDSSFHSHSSVKDTNFANPITQEDNRSENCVSQDETINSQKKRQRHKKKMAIKDETNESTLLHIDSNKLSADETKTISFTKELLIKEANHNASEKVSHSPVLNTLEGSITADNTTYKDISEKLPSRENGPLVISKEKLVKQSSKIETRIDNEENEPQKSKAELRKERRALQEAQRAAKAAGKPIANIPLARKTSLPSTVQQVPKRVSDSLKLDDEKVQKKIAKKLEKQQIPQRTTVQKKVGLFSHLYQYEHEISLTQGMLFSSTGIHPAIIKLGLQYAEGVTCGSNARCIALLCTFKRVIADYVTPPQKELSRDLEAKIKPYINFLTQCRPLSVSMSNAIKYIKWHITHIARELTDSEAKIRLYESIDNFYKEKIILADEAISKDYAFAKINNGDVILTYAFSSLVCKVLCDAYDSGKKFQVIVTDARPKMEGQELLRRLVRHGIQCSYILINAVSYIMREVSKVFLGAHALQANGYVMSRVGSSQISLVAKAYNVPVLVCCETYKFCERVQTDAFVCNELGDPDDLVSTNTKVTYLSDWRDVQQLNLLNLVYDVTPPDFVAMVITELGMLPCTSVPVVLRVKHAETSDF